MAEMLKLRDSVFMINDDIWNKFTKVHITEQVCLFG